MKRAQRRIVFLFRLALEVDGRRRARCGDAGDPAAVARLHKEDGDPGGAGPVNGLQAESF
jgi:hypothetical protein